MNLVTAHVSWLTPATPDPSIGSWEVWGSTDPDIPGRKLASVAANQRSAKFTIFKGNWTFRVLARSKGGALQDWKAAIAHTRDVSAAELPVAAPKEVAIGVTETSAQGAVDVGPVAADDDTALVQVIDHKTGDDPVQGELVAEKPVRDEGADRDGAVRDETVPFGMGGYGLGVDQHLTVRPVGTGGRAGTVAEQDVVAPKLYDEESITLIDVRPDTAYVGWPTATSSDPWEFDDTALGDGIRMRLLPAPHRADCGDWGTEQSGLMKDLGLDGSALYVNRATVESSVVSLARVMVAAIDIAGRWRRKTATPPVTLTEHDVPKFPADPRAAEELEGLPLGAAHRACMVDENCKPLHPIPPSLWEYKISEDNVVWSGWRPARQGRYEKFRYLQVRNTVHDPIGLYQLYMDRVTVQARLKRRVFAGQATKPAVATTHTVTLPTDPDTGVSPFANTFDPTVTPSAAGRALCPDIVSVNPVAPSFTVRFYDHLNALVSDEVTFHYHAIGY